MSANSDVVDIEFLGDLDLCDLDLVGHVLNALFRLLKRLLAFLLRKFLVCRLRRGLHLLLLCSLLSLDQLALRGLLRRCFGFLLGFFLTVVAFLAVVLLQPRDEVCEQRFNLLLSLAVIENTVPVQLLGALEPLRVEFIWVQTLVVQQLEEVHQVRLHFGVFAEVEQNGLQKAVAAD